MKKLFNVFLSLAMLVTAGLTTASCSNDDNPTEPPNPALAEALVGEWIFEQVADGIEYYDFDNETMTSADGCTLAVLYHFYDDGTCWKEVNLMKDDKLVDQHISRYATFESTYTVDASGKVVITITNIEAESDESEVLTFDGTKLTAKGADVNYPLVRATDAQIQVYKDLSDVWYGGNAEEAESRPLSEAEVFDVVGSDGRAYKNYKRILPEGVTAVAMVAYKNGTNGLALSLVDDGLYVDWKTAKSICESKTAVPGGTWRLPSIYDWQNMFIGCGVKGTVSDNPTSMRYTVLASRIVSVGGARIQSGLYWSSTEYTPNHKIWYLTFFTGTASFNTNPESYRYYVRACFAF